MTEEKSVLFIFYIHGIYKGRNRADTETIAHVVAGVLSYENYAIVKGFNKLVLTTFGSFLNNVSDQEWLKQELLPILIPLQMNQEDINIVFFYYLKEEFSVLKC